MYVLFVLEPGGSHAEVLVFDRFQHHLAHCARIAEVFVAELVQECHVLAQVLAGLFFSMATLTRTPLVFAGLFFVLEALCPGPDRLSQLRALGANWKPAARKLGLFAAGAAPRVFSWRGVKLGVLICEEVWDDKFAKKLAAQGAEILLVQNASPYHIGKANQRKKVVDAAVAATGLPAVYLNLVGGQDELVFDGRSYVRGVAGKDVCRLAAFREDLAITKWERIAERDMGQSGAAGVPLPAGEAGLLSEPKVRFSNPGEGDVSQADSRPHPDLQPNAKERLGKSDLSRGRGGPAAPLLPNNAVLVGGLYGVSLGAAFFGESMFSRAADASKIALVRLVEILRAAGYELLDTQYVNEHLKQFGVEAWSKENYMMKLEKALSASPNPSTRFVTASVRSGDAS